MNKECNVLEETKQEEISCKKNEAAETITRLGYNLIPATRNKTPLIAWERYQRYPVTEAEMRFWYKNPWQISPVNWAVLTGKKDYSDSPGLVVIDADDQEAISLVRQLCPETPLTTTTSQGMHFFYRRCPDAEYVGSRGGTTIDGVDYRLDIKADKSYVIAPGASHKSGFLYRWNEKWSLDLLYSLPIYDEAWLPDEKTSSSSVCGDYEQIDHTEEINAIEMPMQERVSLAKELIKNKPGAEAEAGRGARRYCYGIAIMLVWELALDYQNAFELLNEWGQRDDQKYGNGDRYPWSEKEISDNIKGAIKDSVDPKRIGSELDYDKYHNKLSFIILMGVDWIVPFELEALQEPQQSLGEVQESHEIKETKQPIKEVQEAIPEPLLDAAEAGFRDDPQATKILDVNAQRDIITVLSQNIEICIFASQNLQSENFTLKAHRKIITIIFEYVKKYNGKLPSKKIINHEFKKLIADDKDADKQIKELNDTIVNNQIDIDEHQWYRDTITDFALQSRYNKAIEQFNSSEIDRMKLIEVLSNAQRVVGQIPQKAFRLGERGDVRSKWLISPLMRQNNIVCMFGASGCRKTFLSIDLALACATGTPFLNRFTIKEPQKVFYIISEGSDDFETRCKAWSRHRGVDLPSDNFAYYPAAFDFSTDVAVTDCVHHIEEKLGKADLIVIDTFAKNFSGDESSNPEIGMFITQMEELRRQTNACILLIHHTGHSKSATHRARGASAFNAGIDSSMLVELETDQHSVIECKKMKSGPKFEKIWVKFESIRLEELDTEDDIASSLVGGFSETQEVKLEDEFIKILDGVFDIQEEYSTMNLIEACRQYWRKGIAPGNKRVRELIDAEINNTLICEKVGKKNIFRRKSL